MSSSAALEVCSELAAFACVTLSIWDIAVPICWMPCACSLAAMAISATRTSAAATFSTICSSDSPTLPQHFEPRCVLAIAVSILSAVSLAAVALRWASERTSSATTAKPAPASPARAASTAALRARMFVWNAISSMFFTIFETSMLDVSIDCIAATISAIVCRPAWAAVRAWFANSFALTALSAVERIIAEISSSDALVSATDAPCSLQPDASVRLAVESWRELIAVWSAPCWIESEIASSVWFVRCVPARIAAATESNAARVIRTAFQPISPPARPASARRGGTSR